MDKIPCFVCGKALESVFPDLYQPYDATSFVSYGHYGSTVFDPMDGTYLRIIICDEHLKERHEAVFICKRIEKTFEVTSEPWNPNEEN